MPKVPKPYILNESASFTYKQLKKLGHEDLITIMRNWFFERYEDPVNDCPYVEGEYIFIHGGPYDAYEILSSEFIEERFERAVKELADDLNSECPDWAKKDDGSAFLDYYYEVIEYLDSEKTFQEALEIIKKLLKIRVPNNLYQKYVNMLYANVISTLETYLFDTFIKLVTGNGQYRSKYIALKKAKKFKGKTVKYSDLYSQMEKIESDNIRYLSALNWHNLEKVENEYRDLIGIDFSKFKNLLNNSIKIRHDIVHRNGKKIDGSKLIIKKNEVVKLINLCKKFINYLHPLIENKLFDIEEKNKEVGVTIDYSDSPY